LIFGDPDPVTNYNLWTVSLAGERQQRPIVRTPALDAGGRSSRTETRRAAC